MWHHKDVFLWIPSLQNFLDANLRHTEFVARINAGIPEWNLSPLEFPSDFDGISRIFSKSSCERNHLDHSFLALELIYAGRLDRAHHRDRLTTKLRNGNHDVGGADVSAQLLIQNLLKLSNS